MSTDRLLDIIDRLTQRVAALETRERLRAVPVSGGIIDSGGLTSKLDIHATNFPIIELRRLSQSADERRWELLVINNELRIRASNDANTSFGDALRIFRSGATITEMRFAGRILAAGLRTNPSPPDAGELFVDSSGFVKRG